MDSPVKWFWRRFFSDRFAAVSPILRSAATCALATSRYHTYADAGSCDGYGAGGGRPAMYQCYVQMAICCTASRFMHRRRQGGDSLLDTVSKSNNVPTQDCESQPLFGATRIKKRKFHVGHARGRKLLFPDHEESVHQVAHHTHVVYVSGVWRSANQETQHWPRRE